MRMKSVTDTKEKCLFIDTSGEPRQNVLAQYVKFSLGVSVTIFLASIFSVSTIMGATERQ